MVIRVIRVYLNELGGHNELRNENASNTTDGSWHLKRALVTYTTPVVEETLAFGSVDNGLAGGWSTSTLNSISILITHTHTHTHLPKYVKL